MTSKQIIKLLLQNGFVLVPDEWKGSHRVYRNPQTGKRTVVPNHSGDLKKGTVQAILKQAGLK